MISHEWTVTPACSHRGGAAACPNDPESMITRPAHDCRSEKRFRLLCYSPAGVLTAACQQSRHVGSVGIRCSPSFDHVSRPAKTRVFTRSAIPPPGLAGVRTGQGGVGGCRPQWELARWQRPAACCGVVCFGLRCVHNVSDEWCPAIDVRRVGSRRKPSRSHARGEGLRVSFCPGFEAATALPPIWSDV